MSILSFSISTSAGLWLLLALLVVPGTASVRSQGCLIGSKIAPVPGA